MKIVVGSLVLINAILITSIVASCAAALFYVNTLETLLSYLPFLSFIKVKHTAHGYILADILIKEQMVLVNYIMFVHESDNIHYSHHLEPEKKQHTAAESDK